MEAFPADVEAKLGKIEEKGNPKQPNVTQCTPHPGRATPAHPRSRASAAQTQCITKLYSLKLTRRIGGFRSIAGRPDSFDFRAIAAEVLLGLQLDFSLRTSVCRPSDQKPNKKENNKRTNTKGKPLANNSNNADEPPAVLSGFDVLLM